jgi:Zn finger protein HypA/HybF involved in hydrogenase expression
MIHGKRKTPEVSVLRPDPLDPEGLPADEDDGPAADSQVQTLRPEVHAPQSASAERGGCSAGEVTATDVSQGRAELFRSLAILQGRIEALLSQVRELFYKVVLTGHRCLHCDGRLKMEREGLAACEECDRVIDPTVAFQHCPQCEGNLRLVIRRYRCCRCGRDVPSRFLFDGKVFDADYFRRRMAESRRRRSKTEARQRVKVVAASNTVATGPADIDAVPGLGEALSLLVGQPDPEWVEEARSRFDLAACEQHVLQHLDTEPTRLTDIPPMKDGSRRERIWIFIAVIFLSHAGRVEIRQDDQIIWVTPRETDRERQTVPGDAEAADGLRGPLGRSSA